MKSKKDLLWINVDMVGRAIPDAIEEAINQGVEDEVTSTYQIYCGEKVSDLDRNANLRYTYLISRVTATYVQACIDSAIEGRSFPGLRFWLLRRIIGF